MQPRAILNFKYTLISISILLSHTVYGQSAVEKTNINGIEFTARDSSFSMVFNTRIQSLYQGTLNTSANEWSDRLLIRRSRLKFGGHVYDPSLTYKLELGLSNMDQGDISDATNNAPRLILDAYIKWEFTKNWFLKVGQMKLPGNRERVISSQDLQLVDRSHVNAQFNIDRDKGLEISHITKIGDGIVRGIASISMGEGRNVTQNNSGGYDYTGRIEFLPFGEFEDDGDYTGVDLIRETKPKLSLGITWDYNVGASRIKGQLGDFTGTNTDLETYFADLIFKYQGWTILSEYAHKSVANGPIFGTDTEGNRNFYYTGSGITFQTGYLFRNNYEITGRYTQVLPSTRLIGEDNFQYTLGVSKYISGHKLKVQTDLTLISENQAEDVFMYRLQLEVGI